MHDDPLAIVERENREAIAKRERDSETWDEVPEAPVAPLKKTEADTVDNLDKNLTPDEKAEIARLIRNDID